MTPVEAQKLLDSMLIPFDSEKANINANNTLLKAEKAKLLQVVIDFEAQNEKYNYQNALSDIACIMQCYVKKANKVTRVGGKIAIQPDTMPFLIQQVLFFIAVSCKVYNIKCSPSNIISILKKQGISISHNFFSRMRVTPTEYISMILYRQPELPTNYRGQKHGELAVAIKNLVYQAGKYDVFCDIFGGSGAATCAINRYKASKYVYNEKNKCVYNLFKVLADDKLYLDLISELKLLQRDLKGEGVWLDENVVDFDDEIEKYLVSKRKSNNIDEERLISDGPEEFILDYDKIVKFMSVLKMDISAKNDDFLFNFRDVDYDKISLDKKIFPSDSLDEKYMNGYQSFKSFIDNYDLIVAYDKEYAGLGLNTLYGEYYSNIDKKHIKDSIPNRMEVFKQYRFYKYYAYFTNLVSEPAKNSSTINYYNMVHCAVAEIYLHSLTTMGNVDVSAILRMNYGTGGKKGKSNAPEAFLKKDFKEIITSFHKTIKDTTCECLDCIDVIKLY